MIFFVGKAETTLINWTFWVLNILNFAFMAKADNKPSTNRQSLWVAVTIKYYSAVILNLEILFLCFIGTERSHDPDALDYKFREAFPNVYEKLDYIGFRLYRDPEIVWSLWRLNRKIRWKFISYIAYLMISLYI